VAWPRLGVAGRAVVEAPGRSHNRTGSPTRPTPSPTTCAELPALGRTSRLAGAEAPKGVIHRRPFRGRRPPRWRVFTDGERRCCRPFAVRPPSRFDNARLFSIERLAPGSRSRPRRTIRARAGGGCCTPSRLPVAEFVELAPPALSRQAGPPPFWDAGPYEPRSGAARLDGPGKSSPGVAAGPGRGFAGLAIQRAPRIITHELLAPRRHATARAFVGPPRRAQPHRAPAHPARRPLGVADDEPRRARGPRPFRASRTARLPQKTEPRRARGPPPFETARALYAKANALPERLRGWRRSPASLLPPFNPEPSPRQPRPAPSRSSSTRPTFKRLGALGPAPPPGCGARLTHATRAWAAGSCTTRWRPAEGGIGLGVPTNRRRSSGRGVRPATRPGPGWNAPALLRRWLGWVTATRSPVRLPRALGAFRGAPHRPRAGPRPETPRSARLAAPSPGRGAGERAAPLTPRTTRTADETRALPRRGGDP